MARNARQGLTASFGASGATVGARDGAYASIALQAIGSGAALHAVGLARPLGHANRVEYRRGGATEWFANGPAGVEQGFTIGSEPAGATDGALTLALGVSGTLTARPGAAGGLVLAGAGGKAVLRYGDLSVSDASGRSLPAHMTVAHGRVLINVDTRSARYPIRVDPLAQDAELTNSTEQGEGDFGFSVAIDGGTIVVGAQEAQVGATEHQGAAFVFTEPGSAWSGPVNQVAELTNNSGGPYTNFGWSVAISGKTIVVGARNVGVSYGAVYEFTEPAGGWTGTLQPTATLATPGGFNYDLGYSVAISGSTVVAGGPDAETTGGGSKQGLVSRWFNLFAVNAYSYCCFNRVDRRGAVGAGELDAAPEQRSGAGAAGTYRADGRGGVVVQRRDRRSAWGFAADGHEVARAVLPAPA